MPGTFVRKNPVAEHEHLYCRTTVLAPDFDPHDFLRLLGVPRFLDRIADASDVTFASSICPSSGSDAPRASTRSQRPHRAPRA